jgi:hypothetical protein
MSITITRVGYITVTDVATGLPVSQHQVWDEAIESAINQAPGTECEIVRTARVAISGSALPPPPPPPPPPSPAIGFGFTSRTNVTGTALAQGVAADDQYVFYCNGNTLRRFDKLTLTPLASRDITADAPTDKQQGNGLAARNGVLYVSAAKYVGGVPTGWITEYDRLTLAPVAVHPLGNLGFSEGCAWMDGVGWLVVFHATKIIARFDAAWNLIATYPLSFTITGSSGGFGAGQGYDGIAVDGEYVYLNIHEIYNENVVDSYRWNGVDGFLPIARLGRATATASQGMHRDPTDPNVMWWAERNYSGSDAIVKGSIVR